MTFKPLNVQFEIADEEIAHQLRDLSNDLADYLGDRRIRSAATAKQLLEAVLKDRDLAMHLLGMEAESAAHEPRTKYQTGKPRRSTRKKEGDGEREAA